MNLELETLLRPISESSPCGVDCSFSNDFHAIQQAKTQDDPLLEQGDWISEPRQADWDFVHQTTINLLINQTKDIRLYTWLLEAWSHLDGYQGISQALELTQLSLDQYWLQLHPEIEDDDLDQRLGLLQGMINQLPILVKSISIVNYGAPFSLMDYESLLHQQNIRRKHHDETDDLSNNSQDAFDQAIANTSKSFQVQNFQNFLVVLERWEKLKLSLDNLMGVDAPAFANVDSQLASIQTTLKKIYKAEALNITESKEDSAHHLTSSNDFNQIPENNMVMPTMTTTSSSLSFQPQAQNHLENREQAMRVLQEIADYFQANEPHSPVSYMLQKTIKWSQMPLHEWLNQVIKNENPLEAVQELLGVQQQTNNDW